MQEPLTEQSICRVELLYLSCIRVGVIESAHNLVNTFKVSKIRFKFFISRGQHWSRPDWELCYRSNRGHYDGSDKHHLCEQRPPGANPVQRFMNDEFPQSLAFNTNFFVYPVQIGLDS